MKNSNLITTVILAQAALIFIGFKIPDTSQNDKAKDNIKINDEKVIEVENPLNKISERSKRGEKNGVEYFINYPLLEGVNKSALIPFNIRVNQKIDKIRNHFGFGEVLSNTCSESLMTANISRQYLDYKVYHQNEEMLSLLLIKADYFADNSFPKFSFKTLNYDLRNENFIAFGDLFRKDSKNIFVKLFNKYSRYPLLTSNCQEILLEDFEYYKDSFVLGDSSIKFYFDDCIVCNEHNTEHAIEIPIEEIKPLMINPDVIAGVSSIVK